MAGLSLKELENKHKISFKDLSCFLPLKLEELNKTKIEVHYLGYYLKWTPQEVYYYAVENTGLKARPFRTQGTYQKYASIDDKIDDLHYYTTYIKYGLGRASYDASQEIRNNHINREEGLSLVKRFDGEFPDKYFDEILEYLDIKRDNFFEFLDKFRPSHLWHKSGNGWVLKHNANLDGYKDIS